jgi:hypothetical protein
MPFGSLGFQAHVPLDLPSKQEIASNTSVQQVTKLVPGTTRSYELNKNNHEIHGTVHVNINLIERTNTMQPCSRIYYSNVS